MEPPQARPWGYHGERGITAAFAPADVALYRSLLPAAFEMPDSPLVVVSVIDYHGVGAPLVPYGEGYVLLACRHGRQNGWHVVTMPVDDQTACDGGRSIGFPKYVADHIELQATDGAWLGRVAHEGRDVMRVTFTPAAGAEPSEAISTDPGLPCLLLEPPGVGPAVSQVDTRLFGPRRRVTTAGTAIVQADPRGAWVGLLPAGEAPLAATFDELSGDWVLRQTRLGYPSARKGFISRFRDGGW